MVGTGVGSSGCGHGMAASVDRVKGDRDGRMERGEVWRVCASPHQEGLELSGCRELRIPKLGKICAAVSDLGDGGGRYCFGGYPPPCLFLGI